MPDKSTEKRVQSVWQTQPIEEMKVSLSVMRERAERHRQAARQKVFTGFAVGLLLAVFFGYTALKPRDPFMQVGFSLLAVWAVYFAVLQYWSIWPRQADGELGAATGLDTYRNELERAKEHSQHIWRVIVPLLLSIAVTFLPLIRDANANPRVLMNGLPFFTLLAVWMVLIVRVRRRELIRLQAEIDAVNTLK